MTEPRTIYEQMQHEYFVPDQMIAVYFSQKKYDAVCEKGTKQPFYKPIETAPKDAKDLKDAVDKYKISEEDKYYLLQNCNKEKVLKVFEEIDQTFIENQNKRYVIFYLFACHGIHKEGTQYVAINELDAETGFYQLFDAEKKIRDFAETYPNSYHIAIFACCRQLFNPSWFTIKKNENEDP